MSGDEPQLRDYKDELTACSPRERGMSPTHGAVDTVGGRAPRVSGDEPASSKLSAPWTRCSPRERG